MKLKCLVCKSTDVGLAFAGEKVWLQCYQGHKSPMLHEEKTLTTECLDAWKEKLSRKTSK